MFALDTTIITDKKHYFSGWCPLMLKMYLQKNICHILVQTVINSIITIEMIYIQLYSVREIHFKRTRIFFSTIPYGINYSCSIHLLHKFKQFADISNHKRVPKQTKNNLSIHQDVRGILMRLKEIYIYIYVWNRC